MVTTANPTQTMDAKETAKHFYEEWLGAQKNILQNFIEAQQNFSQAVSSKLPQNVADFYKQYTEQQQSAYKAWADAVAQFEKNFPNATFQGFKFGSIPTAEQNANMVKDMMDAQVSYMKGFFGNITDTAQGPFAQVSKNMLGQVIAMYENWIGNFAKTSNQWQQQAEAFSKHFQNGMSPDTLKNIFGSSDAYVKLMEFYAPIFKGMQDKTLTPETLKELMQPARYKEVIDKVFAFANPDMVHEFFAQGNRLMEVASANTQANFKSYQEMIERNQKLMPELFAGNPQAAVKVYENMYEAYQKNFDPMLRAAINGRDGQMLEITKGIIEKFSAYNTKLNDFQYKVYVTGQKTMEGLAEKNMEAFKQSGEVKDFNAFFKQWVETNEKAFADVFKTEEFSKLQSELMNSNIEIRNDFQKMMELYMADYPVVPRSEMDELYKTIHDLKARLRTLEKTEGAEETAKKAAKK